MTIRTGVRYIDEKESALMDELKRLNRRTVFNGRAIDFCRDTMRLPDGRIEEWDFIHHKKG